MKTYISTLATLLFWPTIAGNLIFILWVLYNGMIEGFGATLPEKISYIGMTALFLINSFLLLLNKKTLK